jgi:hypothetical protein
MDWCVIPRPKINAILAFKFFPTKNVILTS